jgi:hypothetical protein
MSKVKESKDNGAIVYNSEGKAEFSNGNSIWSEAGKIGPLFENTKIDIIIN